MQCQNCSGPCQWKHRQWGRCKAKKGKEKLNLWSYVRVYWEPHFRTIFTSQKGKNRSLIISNYMYLGELSFETKMLLKPAKVGLPLVCSLCCNLRQWCHMLRSKFTKKAVFEAPRVQWFHLNFNLWTDFMHANEVPLLPWPETCPSWVLSNHQHNWFPPFTFAQQALATRVQHVIWFHWQTLI